MRIHAERIMQLYERENRRKRLTMTNRYDILNSSVRKADFLCLNTPLVCDKGTAVFLTDRRTRGFLLEDYMPKGIYKRKKEHNKNISKALKGCKLKPQQGFQKRHKLTRGELNGRWKGDKVGHAIHGWVERRLGKPKLCEKCGTTKAKKYDWSNVDHKYKRDLKDWQRLCASCHMRFDDTATKIWITRRKRQFEKSRG